MMPLPLYERAIKERDPLNPHGFLQYYIDHAIEEYQARNNGTREMATIDNVSWLDGLMDKYQRKKKGREKI